MNFIHRSFNENVHFADDSLAFVFKIPENIVVLLINTIKGSIHNAKEKQCEHTTSVCNEKRKVICEPVLQSLICLEKNVRYVSSSI